MTSKPGVGLVFGGRVELGVGFDVEALRVWNCVLVEKPEEEVEEHTA